MRYILVVFFAFMMLIYISRILLVIDNIIIQHFITCILDKCGISIHFGISRYFFSFVSDLDRKVSQNLRKIAKNKEIYFYAN